MRYLARWSKITFFYLDILFKGPNSFPTIELVLMWPGPPLRPFSDRRGDTATMVDLCWGSNPEPYDQKPSALTTRPPLPQVLVLTHVVLYQEASSLLKWLVQCQQNFEVTYIHFNVCPPPKMWKYEKRWLEYFSSHFTIGVGDFGDMFPIECPVMFFCGKQLGRNVTYLFDYGYKDDEGLPQTSSQWIEKDNETYHLFKMPEGMLFIVEYVFLENLSSIAYLIFKIWLPRYFKHH